MNTIEGVEMCGLCTADATGGMVQGSGITTSGNVYGDGKGDIYIGTERGGEAHFSGGNVGHSGSSDAGGLRIGRRYSGRANYDAASAWSDFAGSMAGGLGRVNGVVVTGGNGVTVSGSAIGDGNTVVTHPSGSGGGRGIFGKGQRPRKRFPRRPRG